MHTLSGNSLEIIRFAAGNRLCVDLDYTDNSGRRSTRIIEPYSLRQDKNGNIFLYEVRADDSEIRAYKINPINDASVTNSVLVLRYQIELSPSRDIPPVLQSSGSADSRVYRIRHPACQAQGVAAQLVVHQVLAMGRPIFTAAPMCDKHLDVRARTQNSIFTKPKRDGHAQEEPDTMRTQSTKTKLSQVFWYRFNQTVIPMFSTISSINLYNHILLHSHSNKVSLGAFKLVFDRLVSTAIGGSIQTTWFLIRCSRYVIFSTRTCIEAFGDTFADTTQKSLS